MVEEVADVIITQPLRLQQLVEVGLHETLDDVHVLHGVEGRRPQDVTDVDNIFMIEPSQYFDLPQGSLTVRLVFKWAYFLDSNLNIVAKSVSLCPLYFPIVICRLTLVLV